MAKMAEMAERYDDMCEFMTKLVKTASGSDDSSLSQEERNLLSVAFKNVIGVRRQSWRTLKSLESSDDENITIYKKQVEEELDVICKEILALLNDHLIASAEVEESQVFYFKMAGDYHRYLAEALERQGDRDKTEEMYDKALKIAQDALPSTHPIRLGLALNFSVCHYEILGNPDTACSMAQVAFDAAISELDELKEDDYKDSTLIMQLLRDNLTLWKESDSSEPVVEDFE